MGQDVYDLHEEAVHIFLRIVGQAAQAWHGPVPWAPEEPVAPDAHHPRLHAVGLRGRNGDADLSEAAWRRGAMQLRQHPWPLFFDLELVGGRLFLLGERSREAFTVLLELAPQLRLGGCFLEQLQCQSFDPVFSCLTKECVLWRGETRRLISPWSVRL